MVHKNVNNDDGFTLVDLLISIAVMGVIVGSLFSFLITQHKYFSLQEEISEMTQNTRASMDMIASEIAMAGYNPSGSDFSEFHTVLHSFRYTLILMEIVSYRSK